MRVVTRLFIHDLVVSVFEMRISFDFGPIDGVYPIFFRNVGSTLRAFPKTILDVGTAFSYYVILVESVEPLKACKAFSHFTFFLWERQTPTDFWGGVVWIGVGRHKILDGRIRVLDKRVNIDVEC